MSRENLKLALIAAFFLAVGLAGPAFAHGVNHALFAHNADKVDGKHANSLTRIASVQTQGAYDETGDVVATLAMKVPGTGLILVNSTVGASASPPSTCWLEGPEGQTSHEMGDGNSNEYSIANTYSFKTEAAPGTTVNIHTKCRTVTPGDGWSWTDMTGIWSPFNSAGGTPRL